MPRPTLPPLRAAFGPAKDLMPRYLGEVLGRLEDHGAYAVIRGEGPCRLGPSMVNDACPIATALRCRLGGLVIRPVRVVNGRVVGRGVDDVNNIVTGLAVHEAYIEMVREANPGWVVQSDTYYTTIVEYGGERLEVGFSPDILIGRGGEWYLVEVKIAPPHTSHEVQLALYWYLLRDYYGVSRAYLVTPGAIIPYGYGDLEPLVRQGLEYLVAVRRVLQSWVGDRPSLVVRGSCPCRFAAACPVYGGVTAFAR